MNHRLLLIGIGLSILFTACKKNIDSSPETEPGPGTPGTNTTIKIVVPQGSAYNPAGSKVMSSMKFTEVDANGTSKIAHDTGTVSIAYVFDKNDNLMLAGYITDSTSVISPASTAKLLLHWAHRFQFEPLSRTERYLSIIDKVPDARAWVTEYERLFLSDPMTLSNGSFVSKLKETITKMTARNGISMYNRNASDIQVDESDIKSGLQVAEDGLSKLSVTNTYRRRGHAFLYKMNYKDENGIKHDLIDKISANTAANKDFAVNPTSGVTAVMGEIGKWVEDKDLESFSVKSGPVELTLEDKEDQAQYKVRIVGPGLPGALLTGAEDTKLLRLQIETFTFDVLIPGFSAIMSLPGKDKPAPTESAKEKMIELALGQIKNIPDVYEEIKQGNYENAFLKLIENVGKDVNGESLNIICEIAAIYHNIDPKSFALAGKLKNLNKIISGFDLVLGAADIYRILKHVAASNAIEEWNVTARASQVRLSPDESIVIPFEQKKISAIIKNLVIQAGTHPFFQWATSGKYGKLTDTKGHSGVSFESADKEVFYASNASAAALSDGDNLEYIYVTAYIGSTKIGTDTAVVNVKKNQYEMKPNGVTLSGKKYPGSQNGINLYLVKANGSNDISSSQFYDYKIVWNTAGKHGKLFGREIDNVTSLTTYNDNTAWYECTDDQTKQGTEKITARIYSKPKQETEYKLYDEVEGSVKIDNDEKKKILHLPFEFGHGDTSQPYGNTGGTSYRCYKYNGVTFNEDTAAKSYSLRFYPGSNPVIGAPLSYSWAAGAPSPHSPASYVGPGYAGGKYTVVYSWGSAQGGVPGHAGGVASPGMAEITIYLK